MIGKLISHYKIINKLGEGGMGVLYLAEDVNINRKAVLKFLPPDVTNEPDINSRFNREAQAAGSLSHPNIVTIYDVGTHDEPQGSRKSFIAMEYVKGKNLRELINSDELTIERIINISVQICEGLNEAHSKGIIHRDIKPENIIIDERGRVKILDFGLAKVKGKTQLTKDGSTLGTVKYMSPEQIMNEKVDQRTDIWSVGVMLYEMITGRYPFKGEHEASLFYAIINDQPEPIARYKSGIGEGFQRIIDKVLDKDPETRYQHIDDLLTDLRRESKDNLLLSKENLARGKKKNKKIFTAIIISLIFIVLIFKFINYLSPKIKQPEYNQITFEGDVYLGQFEDLYPAISPDGKFVSYLLKEKNEISLYVKDLSTGESTEIFNDIREINSLRWSPSRSEILFNAVVFKDSMWSQNGFIVSMLGSKIQKIPYSAISCWSPDGSTIATIYDQSSKIIKFINRETGNIIDSVKIKGNFTYLIGFDWSFNNMLLFFTIDDYKNVTSLWTIKVDGTNQEKIFDYKEAIYCCRWSSDANFIFFLRSNKNTFDLEKIKISSEGISEGEPIVLQTGLQTHGFSLSSDNKKIVYIRYLKFSNIFNVVYNVRNKIFETKKLTNGTSIYKFPKISPDGNRIAFIHEGQVCLLSFEGGKLEQLTNLKSECSYVSWNPNGKELAFISDNNVWTISINGATPTRFSKTESSVFPYITWLSDSVIMYPIPGDINFCMINKNSGVKKFLTQNDSASIHYACANHNGKKVAVYWYRKPSGLWIISPKDSTQMRLTKYYFIPLVWSNDEQLIYGFFSYKDYWYIFKISATTGKFKIVLNLITHHWLVLIRLI